MYFLDGLDTGNDRTDKMATFASPKPVLIFISGHESMSNTDLNLTHGSQDIIIRPTFERGR